MRIEGDEIRVKARLRTIDSFSAHADQKELVAWVKERLPVRQATFLVHGEPPAMAVFREHLSAIGMDPARILAPALDEEFRLRSDALPEPEAAPVRLQPAEAEAAEDWHNAHSHLLLQLSDALRRQPDDAARGALLRRLRDQLPA